MRDLRSYASSFRSVPLVRTSSFHARTSHILLQYLRKTLRGSDDKNSKNFIYNSVKLHFSYSIFQFFICLIIHNVFKFRHANVPKAGPVPAFSFKMLTLILVLLPLVLLVARKFCLKKYKSGRNVCVLVLGDIGRSPRMQYHAASFAREGFTVDVIGYPGSPPTKEIRENARVRIYYLRPSPDLRNSMYIVLLQISPL